MVQSDRFRYRQLDLADVGAVDRVLREVSPDIVFHFAAIHGAAGFSYESIFDQMLAVNTVALHRVLEYARAEKPGLRVLYGGSCKIFGPGLQGVIDEKTPYRGSCLYSVGKVASLELIRYYRSTHGVAAGNLTLFNHDSARRPPEYFLPTVARALAAARRGVTEITEVKTLDFYLDWSSAEELMDIAVDIGEKAPGDDFVLASGITWLGRAAVESLFARYGLDATYSLRQTLPPQDAGAGYQVVLDYLEARIGRRPVRTLFDIVDDIINNKEERTRG